MSTYTDMPIPLRFTIPGLHAPKEVLKLPLRKSGIDTYGLFDYGDSDEKAVRVPHVVTAQGSGYVDTDGYHSAAQSDWAKVTYSANLDFASADLTIAFWVKPTGWITGWNNFIGKRSATSTDGWIINSQETTNQQFRFVSNIGGTWRDPALQGTTTIVLDTWYHVAVTRSGNTWRLFVNGQVEDTDTYSGALADVAKDLGLMASCSTGNEGGGHGVMADLLILKGEALYTANFTPPARGSMVLPHDLFQYNPFEVGNWSFQGHTTDAGFGVAKYAPGTAHSLTLFGNAAITADGLSLPAGTDQAKIGITGQAQLVDFQSLTTAVIEWEVKLGSGTGTAGRYLLASDQDGGANKFFDLYWQMGNNIFGYRDSASAPRTWSFSGLNNDEWRKLTLVITPSANPKLYVDGTELTNGSGNATASIGGNLGVYIGARYDGGSGGTLAYTVRNLRILKGTSIPPAASYRYALQDFRVAKAGVAVPYSAPLRGLNPYSGVCDFWLKGSFNGFYSRHGNASTTSLVAGPGVNGLEFTSGYASFADSDDWTMADEDFTWEAWVYLNADAEMGIIQQMGDANNRIHLFNYDNVDGRNISFYIVSGGSIVISPAIFKSNVATPTGQWVHVAVSRSGNDFHLHTLGVHRKTVTYSITLASLSAALEIGRFYNSTSFNGKIRQVRISKGIARYGEDDFTPPTSYTLDQYTVLQAPFTEYLLDYAVQDGETRSSDVELECYIGNADAPAPTEEVTWPAYMKAMWFRSGFLSDMIGGFDLVNTSATITPDGLYLGGSNYATLPFGTDMTDMFKKVGTDDFCWLVLWTTAELSRRGGLISTHFSTGTRPDAIEAEQQVNNTSLWHFRSVTNPDTNYALVTGSSLSLNVPATTGVRRDGTAYSPISNGVKGSPVTAFQTDIYDENFPIAFGRYATYYAKGTMGVVIFFRGTIPTDDQITVLDRLLREPSTYNEVGELESNISVLDGGDPDASPTRYFDGGDPDSIGTRDIDGGTP
jgi:hypothetical protein